MNPNTPSTSPYAEKPDSGTLWTREKKSDKHPDLGGKAYLSGELVAEMVVRLQRGEKAALMIVAWKKYDKNGEVFLSLALRPYEDRPPIDEAGQNAQYGQPQGPALAPTMQAPQNAGFYSQAPPPPLYPQAPPPPPWAANRAPARPVDPLRQGSQGNPQAGPQPIPPGGRRW